MDTFHKSDHYAIASQFWPIKKFKEFFVEHTLRLPEL